MQGAGCRVEGCAPDEHVVDVWDEGLCGLDAVQPPHVLALRRTLPAEREGRLGARAEGSKPPPFAQGTACFELRSQGEGHVTQSRTRIANQG